MKIVVCGSMSCAKKMMEVKNILEKEGWDVLLPRHTEEYANEKRTAESQEESAENKIEGDLIRGYYEEIKKADAVLAVNEKKKGIENYIGGNTFLEMSFGHVLDKPVYILNDIPRLSYTSEIIAMQPIVLEGDLQKIN